MGHWLGLRHVFEGGCNYPNDFVVDTRPQLYSSRRTHGDFCKPSGIRTCAQNNGIFPPKVWDESPMSLAVQDGFNRWQAGFLVESRANDLHSYDAIGNFMDYDMHHCMKLFTSGQISLMQQNWRFYRSREIN